MQWLLEVGQVDIQGQGCLAWGKFSALFIAAQNGYKDIVALLLHYGADVNFRVNDHMGTPVTIASTKGLLNFLVSIHAPLSHRFTSRSLCTPQAITRSSGCCSRQGRTQMSLTMSRRYTPRPVKASRASPAFFSSMARIQTPRQSAAGLLYLPRHMGTSMSSYFNTSFRRSLP